MRVAVVLLAIAALVFAQDLPTSFDVRDKWPQCTSAILDQGQCGSCWAFSAVTSMTARFCISGHKTMNSSEELSPQYLLDCNRVGQGGCNGGDTFAAYGYIQDSGIDSLTCTPYTSGKTGVITACPTTCKTGESIPKLYQGIDHYSLVKSTTKDTVQAMKEELYKNGPFSVSFVVYSDFMTFFKNTPTGIYQHKTGSALGGHAVKLLGWGVENGVEYWTIANSWGTAWGNKGTFRIVSGKNDCTVESRRVTVGIPKVDGRNTVNKITHTVVDGARTKIAVDQDVIEIARLALSRVANTHDVDTFLGVKEAYAQVVNGVVYDLVLSVGSANGATKDIDVRVVRSALDKFTVY